MIDSPARARARDWNRMKFPAADHELSDTEIENTYGPLIEVFVIDLATSPDLYTLTKVATTGHRIAEKRARTSSTADDRQGIVTA